MILLISENDDPSVQDVFAILQRREQRCQWLHLHFFPSRDRIVYEMSSNGPPFRIYRYDGQNVDLNSVRSVLWRRPDPPKASTMILDAEIRDYIEATSSEVLAGIFEELDCFQVPASRHVLKGAHAKIPQLTLAAKLGFNLPDTLVTNDPAEFMAFYHRHAGRVIIKAASVIANPFLKGMMSGYAQMARPRDLAQFQDVQLCPFIAQAYVEKLIEVRVTVVGSDVFAAEIHSQVTQRTKIDWRHYDEDNTPHFIHSLPDEMSVNCLRLVQAMGLVYGAIDLILTPEGEYVFLEINPNGQYQWIEKLTGLPISDRIARLLVEHV